MRRLAVGASASALRFLNIHEYAAKELMGEFGIPTEKGFMATSLEDARRAVEKISTKRVMVKAQILAGGRGKGKVVGEGGSILQGGVQCCPDHDAAVAMVSRMLGNKLVTKQTGAEGQKISKVYITETVSIAKEMYVALLLDRKSCGPVFIGSAEGGMSIEEVAEKNPDAIHRLPINVYDGIQRDQCMRFAEKLGFSNTERAADILEKLYNLAKQKDCTMVEVNPMAELTNGNVLCLDAKVTIDDNAQYRQQDLWTRYQDLSLMDTREVAALEAELTFVALSGNVGCIVNGAGLSMATMDMVAAYGCSPSNFLDTGGNATAPQIEAALRIITSDKSVACILVNVFGGITRCERIAEGIVQGITKCGPSFNLPVVVRLEGTNSAEGRAIIAAAKGLPLFAADSFDAACAKISEIVNGKK